MLIYYGYDNREAEPFNLPLLTTTSGRVSKTSSSMLRSASSSACSGSGARRPKEMSILWSCGIQNRSNIECVPISTLSGV